MAFFRQRKGSSLEEEFKKLWRSFSGENLLDEVPTRGSVLVGPDRSIPLKVHLHRLFEELITSNNNQTPTAAETALWQIWDGEETEDASVTFAELNQRANILARTIRRILSDHCVPKRSKLTLVSLVPPCANSVALLLATLKIGATFLPLDPCLSAETLKTTLRICPPAAIISIPSLAVLMQEICADCEALVMNIDDVLEMGLSRSFKSDDLLDQEMFCNAGNPVALQMLCDVGESGEDFAPRLVELRHGSLFNRINWQWEILPLKCHEIGCLRRSFIFLDSIVDVLSSLLKGIPLLIVTNAVQEKLPEFISAVEYRYVTRLTLETHRLAAMLLHLADASESRLLYLETVICRGSALSLSLARRFFQLFPHGKTLVNSFESTEACGGITAAVFRCIEDVEDAAHLDLLPVGEARSNTDLYLLDNSKRPVPEGQVGQLYISGVGMAQEYLAASLESKEHAIGARPRSNSESHKNTKQNFIKNSIRPRKHFEYMYSSGDLGFVNNGSMYFKSKKTDVLKSNGQRLYSSSIDTAILSHENIENAVTVVIGKEENKRGRFVTFYTVHDNTLSQAQEVQKYLQQALPADYLRLPPTLVRVNRLPLTLSGKVDRVALRSTYREHVTGEGCGAQEVSDGLEDKIKYVVSKVIGIEKSRIASFDNFFVLGGDSLAAVRCVDALQDQGLHVSLAAFVQCRTLQDLVNMVRRGINVEEFLSDNSMYQYSILSDDDRASITFLAESLALRDALCQLLDIRYRELHKLLETTWELAVMSGASLVAKRRRDDNLLAASICLEGGISNLPIFGTGCANFDALGEFYSACETFVSCELEEVDSVFEPLEDAEAEESGAQQRWLTLFTLTTDIKLAAQENLELVQRLEEETLVAAINEGYDAIQCVSTSMVTQRIREKLGYETVGQILLREYQYDGYRPFREADRDHYAWITVRKLK